MINKILIIVIKFYKGIIIKVFITNYLKYSNKKKIFYYIKIKKKINYTPKLSKKKVKKNILKI